MCCYLYAAFGLRSELSDGLPPDQTNAVKRWRDTILAIAVEEMSHLALVSNLMVALGAHPHLGRQNMPVPPGYHPADIRLALAPFDRQTLDHFIFLERPEGSGVADAASFAAGTHYVRETAAGRFFPAGSDYETIDGLYRDLAAALTKLEGKLGERLLFSGDPALQVGRKRFRSLASSRSGTLWRPRRRSTISCGRARARRATTNTATTGGFVRATAGRLRWAQHAQTQAAIRPRGRATRPTRRSAFVCKPGG